jgi:hypothetical protein
MDLTCVMLVMLVLRVCMQTGTSDVARIFNKDRCLVYRTTYIVPRCVHSNTHTQPLNHSTSAVAIYPHARAYIHISTYEMSTCM